jgi:SpoVK/Ycf46/Vps4 family AAA+-type ATPase
MATRSTRRRRLLPAGRLTAPAAAGILAGALGVDVWRIDLRAVGRRYIGETEERLDRVFDAAERGGAVLLLDEADALYGERTHVKDRHDRYAAVAIDHLRQRVEAYRGLVIFTFGRGGRPGAAFLRRGDFVARVPSPRRRRRLGRR